MGKSRDLPVSRCAVVYGSWFAEAGMFSADEATQNGATIRFVAGFKIYLRGFKVFFAKACLISLAVCATC